MSSIKYRPYVDGLRAFAVIPVLLFHLGFDWIPGGYLGVDVFFVISGFLITSIILKESYQGTFTFRGFWLRRIRRILPVLSVVLICTLLASYFIVFRPDMSGFGKDSFSASFSFANITMWLRTGDYWGTLAESSPFLHTWSLSVEEQFYIFFPVLLVLLLRFGRRFVFPGIVCVTIASFALFIFASQRSPVACFYLLPMRAWELAAGCMLAIFLRNNEWSARGGAASIGAWLGFVSVLTSYFLVSGESGLSVATALPVLGSVLIILFGEVDGFVNRTLSHRWTVYIGKISYSLYLWHWPVFVLGKAYTHSRYSTEPSWVLLLVITLILTLLSYYFVEKPTRSMKRIIPCAMILFSGSVGVSVYFMFGAYSMTYDTSKFNTVEYYGESYDVSPTQPALLRENRLKRQGIFAPKRRDEVATAYLDGGLLRLYGAESPEVVLFGDSHGLMWAKLVDEVCEELGVSVALAGMTGTNPFFAIPTKQNQKATSRYTAEQKFQFDQARYEGLQKWQPALVIIATRWSQRYYNGLDDKRPLLDFIAGQNARVLLMQQPPELSIGNSNTSQYFAYLGMGTNSDQDTVTQGSPLEYKKGLQLVETISQTFSHVDVFDVSSTFLTEANEVRVRSENEIFYYDDDHLSQQGALLFKAKLKEKIAASLGK